MSYIVLSLTNIVIWSEYPLYDSDLWSSGGIGLSSQSDQCDLRAYSDACREDGFSEAGVYVECLSVPGIEASVLFEYEAAWAPAKE